MKIHLLSFGRLVLPQSLLYGDDFPSDQSGISPMYGVLIDHPDGKILYDTGLMLDDIGLTYIRTDHLQFTDDDSIDNRLQSIGLAPEDIDYVVISHMHEDHCGNIHKFTNAEILVNKEEFVGTMVNYGLGTPRLMPPEYVQTWVAYKPKWRLVEVPETLLVPGVTVCAFGLGHNFGMLMLRVETEENGVIFMVQDLIYSKELLNKKKLPGIVRDEEGYYRAVEQIKERARIENAAIWFGHDIEQFNSLVHAPEGYYR